MSTIYLITGGARSGKSSYAQQLCESLSESPIYLATAPKPENDPDFCHRIQKHQDHRGEQWTTIEEPLYPSKYHELDERGNHSEVGRFQRKVVLIDCLTLWLTNFMMKEGLFSQEIENDGKQSIQEASERALANLKQEFETLTKPWNCTFVVVTNELGSGTHAEHLATRKFVDAQGWMNQHVAKQAKSVIHMVSGCPNFLKEPSNNGGGLPIPSKQQQREALMLDQFLSKRFMEMDKNGYFIVKVDTEKLVIRISFHSCIVNDKGEFFDLKGNRLTCHGGSPEPLKVWECRTAKDATHQILEQWEPGKELLCIGHAGYLAREVQKAEYALYNGIKYQQD
jgi:adenosylcobinamide kinase/adenosylcobinamide-phosphate guanylyltransferase